MKHDAGMVRKLLELDLAAVLVGYNLLREDARRIAQQAAESAAGCASLRSMNWGAGGTGYQAVRKDQRRNRAVLQAAKGETR